MTLKPLHFAGGDNHEEAYNQVYDDNNPPYDDDNKAKFSHEAVGGKLRLLKRLCDLALAAVAPDVAQRVTFAEVDFANLQELLPSSPCVSMRSIKLPMVSHQATSLLRNLWLAWLVPR